jgi:hypothetical protein
MLLFLLALVVAVAGVGAYAHYNPGVHDITLRSHHFAAVPDWVPVALAAGVPLAVFLLDAVFASSHIRHLERAAEDTAVRWIQVRARTRAGRGDPPAPTSSPRR